MKQRLTSFILVLALSFSLSLPAFAVDDIDYYSLPTVDGSEPSAANFYSVQPFEFSGSDSTTLTNIYKIIQYLYLSPASWQSNSVIGFLEKIFDRLPSNLGINFSLQGGDGTNAILDDIRKWTMFSYNYLSSDNVAGNLGNIQRNTASTADRLLTLVTALGGGGLASENTLSAFSAYFSRVFSDKALNDLSRTDLCYIPSFIGGQKEWTTLPQFLYNYSYWIGHNGLSHGQPTLYRCLRLLQETLASEGDRKLAENYKENRDQAENDFLNGQSGPTSLGKGDFANASQVGGALNNTFNMGGAAKVSDFLSGFGSAGSESQAWFSQTTANNLNAVEASDGTGGVSTFADDGQTMVDVDSDPYNMASIFERYDWLEGVNIDD